MKKTLFTSLIAVLALISPSFAQSGADLTASATKEPVVIKEVAPKPKVEPLAIRRQKIEKDLRATILKIQTVIDRTSIVIDLLNKNEKDTTEATKYLLEAQASLDDANLALEQFIGVVIPETKIELKAKIDERSASTLSIKEVPAPAILKDPLKKAEEALKDSKKSLTDSIKSLKDLLIPKEE
jgi:hypothetical protein